MKSSTNAHVAAPSTSSSPATSSSSLARALVSSVTSVLLAASLLLLLIGATSQQWIIATASVDFAPKMFVGLAHSCVGGARCHPNADYDESFFLGCTTGRRMLTGAVAMLSIAIIVAGVATVMFWWVSLRPREPIARPDGFIATPSYSSASFEDRSPTGDAAVDSAEGRASAARQWLLVSVVGLIVAVLIATIGLILFWSGLDAFTTACAKGSTATPLCATPSICTLGYSHGTAVAGWAVLCVAAVSALVLLLLEHLNVKSANDGLSPARKVARADTIATSQDDSRPRDESHPSQHPDEPQLRPQAAQRRTATESDERLPPVNRVTPRQNNESRAASQHTQAAAAAQSQPQPRSSANQLEIQRFEQSIRLQDAERHRNVLPPGTWIRTEGANSTLYWSNEERLYYDVDSMCYFDPESQMWFDPVSREWFEVDS